MTNVKSLRAEAVEGFKDKPRLFLRTRLDENPFDLGMAPSPGVLQGVRGWLGSLG